MGCRRITAVLAAFSAVLIMGSVTYADAIAAAPRDDHVDQSSADKDMELPESKEELSNPILEELTSTLWVKYLDDAILLLEFRSDGKGAGAQVAMNSTGTAIPEEFIWVQSGNKIIVQADGMVYQYEYNNENGNPSLLEYDDSGKVTGIHVPADGRAEEIWCEAKRNAEDFSETEQEIPKELVALSFELEDGSQILNRDNIADVNMVQYTDPVTGKEEYLIKILFDEEGKETFRKATTEHIGEVIHILVDGEVISAPRVQEPITNGTCMISGFDSHEDAQSLVDALKP